MRLNTEFYASTKLKDWYPVVKENFEIIQAKTNEIEGKVNNAMTKRDVNVYFNQVLESTGTNINAVEELAKAIENADQSIAEALRDLSGGRLRAVTVAAADCAGTSLDAELERPPFKMQPAIVMSVSESSSIPFKMYCVLA